MLSKSKIKYIRSLESKKKRNDCGVFVAEGNKLVADMLPFYSCELLIAKSSWITTQGEIQTKELLIADDNDIPKASFLKHPQDVLAVFKLPEWSIEDVRPAEELVLLLDGIQDPGNLGTIIRLADWFGIKHIICSFDCADVFNPKVVQATMGALAHVQIHYTHPEEYLKQQKSNHIPLYGTFLDGEDLYTHELTNHGILIMGSEGKGIRGSVEEFVNKRLYIPSYPANQVTSESLNVAVATAIVCAEFRRRSIQAG